MKRPLISIVMTVYNNEIYFPIAVNNIEKQDFKDWELIIVDDGSTDQTGAIADRLAEENSKINVIHQENQWVYAALNNGIKHASGQYIFVHNSDDLITKDALKILADRINEYRPDVIFVPVIYHKCDKNQKILEYDFAHVGNLVEKEFVCFSKKEVEEHWVYFWQKCLSDNQVNCYKSEIMKSHPFHTDMFCADAIFNTEIADQIKSAVVLKEPLYICFRYCVDDFNASFGKWYPNEHEMYNFMYSGFRNLMEKWNRPKEEYVEFYNNWRINIFSMEMDRLANLCSTLSASEKRKLLSEKYIDDQIKNIAKESHREEELERRIVAGKAKIH